jgi:hypothetical protein
MAVQRRNQWQHAAKLTMEAATGGDVDAATDQLKLALLLDGKAKPLRVTAAQTL